MDDADPVGHFALGAAYMWNKELDRAQAQAERSLVLSPNSADGLRMTAHIKIFAGDPAGALEDLDAYMKRDPHYPDMALQLVADARFALGQYEEAIAAIEQRLVRTPNSETAYALLASCHGHLGRPDECQKAWEAGGSGSIPPSRWRAAAASCRSDARRISSAASKACARAD